MTFFLYENPNRLQKDRNWSCLQKSTSFCMQLIKWSTCKNLFSHTGLIRDRKYIFTCESLEWSACENISHLFTILFSSSLFPFSPLQFFSPPLLSLPLQIFTSLSSLSLLSFPFPSLFLSSPPLSRRHRGPPSHGSVVGDDGGRWGQRMMTAWAAWVQHGSGRRRRQSRVWGFFFYSFSLNLFSHVAGIGDRMRKTDFCMSLRYPHAKIPIFAYLLVHAVALATCKIRFYLHVKTIWVVVIPLGV